MRFVLQVVVIDASSFGTPVTACGADGDGRSLQAASAMRVVRDTARIANRCDTSAS
jgi:hypothetical protein